MIVDHDKVHETFIKKNNFEQIKSSHCYTCKFCRRFRVGDESLYCSLASKKANMYVNRNYICDKYKEE